jgi:hypothetical protein
LDEGADSLKKRRKLRKLINDELNQDYPLFAHEAQQLRENLYEAVTALYEAESSAIMALKETTFVHGVR